MIHSSQNRHFKDGDDFTAVEASMQYIGYSELYGEAHYVCKSTVFVEGRWEIIYIRLNASEERDD